MSSYKYKKITDIKQIQALELEILDAIDLFCKKHKIKYSLGGGTMLGAVRHGGFIPWDDDIDLFMTRDQYDKFISIVQHKNRYITPRYKVFLPEDDFYIYPFIKVIDSYTMVYEQYVNKENKIGVWIDIFPIDYCFNDTKQNIQFMLERKKIIKNMFRFGSSSHSKNLFRYLAKKVYLSIFSLMGKNQKYWLMRALQLPNIQESDFRGPIVWSTTLLDIHPTYYFDDYTTLPFENRCYMVFTHYHEILSRRYGEYMILPPENERHSHSFEAYLIKDKIEQIE